MTRAENRRCGMGAGECRAVARLECDEIAQFHIEGIGDSYVHGDAGIVLALFDAVDMGLIGADHLGELVLGQTLVLALPTDLGAQFHDTFPCRCSVHGFILWLCPF